MEYWPRGESTETLLSIALVQPHEFAAFAAKRREARLLDRTIVPPIPVILLDDETPADYEAKLLETIKLSSDPKMARGQRVNFAESRMRKWTENNQPLQKPSTGAASGAHKQPRGLYAMTVTASAARQPRDQGRLAIHSVQAPMYPPRAGNRANGRGTGGRAFDDASRRGASRHGTSGYPSYLAGTPAVPAYTNATGLDSVYQQRVIALESQCRRLEKTVESLDRRVGSHDEELRRVLDLGREGYQKNKERHVALEKKVRAQARGRTRSPKPASRKKRERSPSAGRLRSGSEDEFSQDEVKSPAYSSEGSD
jgi:hypothetical protein